MTVESALGRRMSSLSGDQGFSLIELVVSLAILSLIVALVAPNGVRLVERFERHRALESIRLTVAAQREKAIARNQTLRIETSDLPLVLVKARVPSAWQVSLSAPMVFSSAGICNGAVLTIALEGDEVRNYGLDPQTCRLAELDADQ